MDFYEYLEEAVNNNKHVMIYFHQTLMQLEQTKTLLKTMQIIQLNALSDAKIITHQASEPLLKNGMRI